MRRGPKPDSTYPLDKDEIVIGRGSKNDIIIHDNEVSREHIVLRRIEDGFELEDLTSSNGTYVNGQPVDGVWVLKSRCIIELGDSITFEYHLGEPNEETSEIKPNELQLGEAPLLAHYLIVTLNSQNEPSIYPLNEPSIKVGRGVTNDIVLVEPEMSREHFMLTLAGRNYKIEDLGSTNGTMVNGELLTDDRMLTPDDIIQIGMMVQMRYSTSADQAIANAPTRSLDDTDELPMRYVTDTKKQRRKTTTPEQMPILSMQNQNNATVLGTGLEQTDLKDQILITYAREDWESTIAPLLHSLQEDKIGAWVDQYLIKGSNDWRNAVEQARLECWLLLVVITESSMNSDLVRRNWRHFHNREKPVILLVRDLVDQLPIGSDKHVQIDYNPALPQVAFQQIIAEIQRLKS